VEEHPSNRVGVPAVGNETRKDAPDDLIAFARKVDDGLGVTEVPTQRAVAECRATHVPIS